MAMCAVKLRRALVGLNGQIAIERSETAGQRLCTEKYHNWAIFICDWKISCNYWSAQGKSRTDGQRWARPRKRNAIIFWSDCQDLVSNTRCDGFQERVMKRKERDVMVWACE